MFIIDKLLLPHEMRKIIGQRAKETRLLVNMTQQELASRSGVSLSTVKRFEQTGNIAFGSLLEIAFVLNKMENFGELFKAPEITSLFEKEPKLRQRARKID